MTITTNPVRNQYTAINNQAVFNYTFKIYDSTDLNVYLTPAGQEPDDNNDLITSYTVDPNTIGDENGGFLTLDTGASAGDTLTIVSSIPYDRETDYQVNGDFAPSTVNNDFDRVVSLVKQNQGDIQRAVLLPESGDGQNVTIPNPSEQEGLKWESGDLVNTKITETVSTDSTEYKLVAITGNDVKVRGLKQGQNVTLTDDGTDITIKAEVQGGQGDVSTNSTNTYDQGTFQIFDGVGAWDYTLYSSGSGVTTGTTVDLAVISLDNDGSWYEIEHTVTYSGNGVASHEFRGGASVDTPFDQGFLLARYTGSKSTIDSGGDRDVTTGGYTTYSTNGANEGISITIKGIVKTLSSGGVAKITAQVEYTGTGTASYTKGILKQRKIPASKITDNT